MRVARTGGIGGMRREWLAAPGPAEAPRWAELIERCGWHDTPSARTGADRFVWDIRAHCGSEEMAIGSVSDVSRIAQCDTVLDPC